jgi:hypothetical protein
VEILDTWNQTFNNSIPVILWLNVVTHSEDVVVVLVCVEDGPEFKIKRQ